MSKKSVSNTSVKHGKFSIMPLGVGGGRAYLFQACLRERGVIEKGGGVFSLADSDF